MKHMRKILSLVLALMLVFSLSVTAFATEANGTATVRVVVNGVAQPDQAAAAGQSVYTYLLNTYHNTDGWYSFPDINGDTAMALNSMTVDGHTYTNGAIDGRTTNITVQAWGSITGYGLVSLNEANGQITGYNYVYVGNSWVYSVKDQNNATVDVSDKYMNQYNMQVGDVVTVEFKQVESYWTSEDPILPTEPYC